MELDLNGGMIVNGMFMFPVNLRLRCGTFTRISFALIGRRPTLWSMGTAADLAGISMSNPSSMKPTMTKGMGSSNGTRKARARQGVCHTVKAAHEYGRSRTGRSIVLFAASLLTFVQNAAADSLYLTLNNPSGNDPFMVIKHMDGASEGVDGNDATHLGGPGSDRIDIYSKIQGSAEDYSINALPSDSLTVVTNLAVGINLSSPKNVSLESVLVSNNGAFTNKILNLDIYVISNGSPVFQGTFDARVITNGNGVPLTINTGHSYDIVFRPTRANNPPVAAAQSVTNLAESATPIVLSGTDVDGDALTYEVTTQPLHGALTGGGSNVVFKSVNNYYGPDSFGFVVSDGSATSAVATVSLTVMPLNRLPVVSGIGLAGTNVELNAQVQPNRTTLPQLANPLDGGWSDLSGLAVSPPWNTNLYEPAVFTIPLGTNGAGFHRLRSFVP